MFALVCVRARLLSVPIDATDWTALAAVRAGDKRLFTARTAAKAALNLAAFGTPERRALIRPSDIAEVKAVTTRRLKGESK